jgi:hypothetical protein
MRERRGTFTTLEKWGSRRGGCGPREFSSPSLLFFRGDSSLFIHSFIPFSIFFLFETGSCYIAQGGLKLTILLSQLPKF